jgi:hypothetical protein
MCDLLWWYGVAFSFLKNNEWIALWVEGIALILIFIWDRKDARDAREESAEQLKVSRDQVEATHKPFVSYSSLPRLGDDVAADVDNHHAATTIFCPESLAQIKNYGSGPAINVRYTATPTEPEASILRPKGYLVALRQGAHFKTHIARSNLQNHEWETIITYESLSGQKYQTKIISNELVMTDISVTRL